MKKVPGIGSWTVAKGDARRAAYGGRDVTRAHVVAVAIAAWLSPRLSLVFWLPLDFLLAPPSLATAASSKQTPPA